MTTILLFATGLVIGWLWGSHQQHRKYNAVKPLVSTDLDLSETLARTRNELREAKSIIADLYIEAAGKEAIIDTWQPGERMTDFSIDEDTFTADLKFKALVNTSLLGTFENSPTHQVLIKEFIERYGKDMAKKIMVGNSFKEFLLLSDEEKCMPYQTNRAMYLAFYSMLVERNFESVADKIRQSSPE